MNRRESIKNLVLVTGSLVALPAFSEAGTEQNILASVVDTIIPQGNGIGALSVGVDTYLQKMIDNCFEPDVRENVKKQLAILSEKNFSQLNQQEREKLLLESDKDFFNLMKSETIRGFTTSKEVMLQHLKYKIAPGHYYGCVDVKAS
ncbi:MAG: gluconate 2-dehydrogenase subunit 3 family protein [Bacteroidota bacterium]